MKFTVLIVEDNQFMIDKIESAIKSIGLESKVLLAYNIEDAYQFTKTTTIDLILVDLLLENHGETGWTFVSDIREKYSLTPIIAVSAIDDFERKFTAFKTLNLFSFIEKPFQNFQVVTEIKKALPLAKLINNRTVTFRRNNFTKTYRTTDIYCIQRIPNGQKKIAITAYDELLGHVTTEEFPIKSSLTEILDYFDNENDIARCHQSWFVNPKFIRTFNVHTDEIILANNMNIPIGDTYRNDLAPFI